MKAILTILMAAALGISAAARAGTIDLPVYGFSMDGLEGPVGSSPVSAVMSFLPASEGFGPNINVQIQPYAGSIQDYAKLSKHQFLQIGGKVTSEKFVGDDEWQVDYTGGVRGMDLQFYARALLKDGKVYLVTGTAKPSQWINLGGTLRKHVDSFELK